MPVRMRQIRWEVPPSRRTAFVLVLVVMTASVFVTVFSGYRQGGYVLGLALFLAAMFRAFLPEEYCLGLLVRSRWFDTMTTSFLAGAVVVSVRLVPGG